MRASSPLTLALALLAALCALHCARANLATSRGTFRPAGKRLWERSRRAGDAGGARHLAELLGTLDEARLHRLDNQLAHEMDLAELVDEAFREGVVRPRVAMPNA